MHQILQYYLTCVITWNRLRNEPESFMIIIFYCFIFPSLIFSMFWRNTRFYLLLSSDRKGTCHNDDSNDFLVSIKRVPNLIIADLFPWSKSILHSLQLITRCQKNWVKLWRLVFKRSWLQNKSTTATSQARLLSSSPQKARLFFLPMIRREVKNKNTKPTAAHWTTFGRQDDSGWNDSCLSWRNIRVSMICRNN